MGGADWNTTRAWVYRTLLAVLVLGSLTVLARTIVGGGNDGDKPPREKVERVRGGDAVKLKSGEKLVYAGIRSPRGEEPLSDEADQRNAELVEGRRVRLRFDEQRRNHDDRLIAYVFVDGEFVNETLVREGLAYVRLTDGSRRFTDKLLAAQSDARRAKRGLWSVPAPDREARYPADAKYGNFHRPACRDAANINPQRLVEFQRRREALDQGFAPCGRCRP